MNEISSITRGRSGISAPKKTEALDRQARQHKPRFKRCGLSLSQACIKEYCAWWLEYVEACSVAVLAEGFDRAPIKRIQKKPLKKKARKR